jgi:hypothetical protein
MPLSDVAVRAIRPRERAYKVHDRNGLFLLVNHSVVRQTDDHLLRATRARVTFSKMSLALAVQMKGLGFWLCAST